jgi:hypothetical protein
MKFYKDIYTDLYDKDSIKVIGAAYERINAFEIKNKDSKLLQPIVNEIVDKVRSDIVESKKKLQRQSNSPDVTKK